MQKSFLLNSLVLVYFIGFQSCNRSTDSNTTQYTFNLTQPDGTVPESGYALIYEKRLDPTTGFASLRVPISDTLRWLGDEISWTDFRKCPNHSLTIGCFSPEHLTNDALRHEWYSLDERTPEIELSFVQSRSVSITIRNFPQGESNTCTWGVLISLFKDDLIPFEDSNYSRSHLNAISCSEGHVISMIAQIEFDEFSTLYAHLFRLGNGEWIPSGRYDLAIHENCTKFEFHSNNTMSCFE